MVLCVCLRPNNVLVILGWLPGFNQYYIREGDEVSCSRTLHHAAGEKKFNLHEPQSVKTSLNDEAVKMCLLTYI